MEIYTINWLAYEKKEILILIMRFAYVFHYQPIKGWKCMGVYTAL